MLMEKETFWDNRDEDWYLNNVPLLDCPDTDIETTWWYRFELLTKHLTYGSADTGYVFTEFLDRPFWSGAYGAISCPVGHQLAEARWLRSPRIARDYARYWVNTPGAQPRNYSTWLADAVWGVHLVHPARLHLGAPGRPAATTADVFPGDILAGLEANQQGWHDRHFVAATGLPWQVGHEGHPPRGAELSAELHRLPMGRSRGARADGGSPRPARQGRRAPGRCGDAAGDDGSGAVGRAARFLPRRLPR
jgi:hypothetical protein